MAVILDPLPNFALHFLSVKVLDRARPWWLPPRGRVHAAWWMASAALLLAISVPIAQILTLMLTTESGHWFVPAAATVFRGSIVVIMALWFSRLSEYEHELHEEVQTLKGLLPICSFCKSIRNEWGEWERLERFISRRSETQFSHGMCPSCLETQYPNIPRADA